MADISINLGDAFLLDTPPNGMHLHIAIAQIAENMYLFVNTTTPRENSDMSCVLNPGLGVPDFIVHKSVIVYKRAREISTTALTNLITKGSCLPKGCFSDSVLLQIQQGGLTSKRLPNKYKTVLKALFDIT
jgi:hypothetical protein